MISATFTPFVWREHVNVGLDSKVMAFNAKKVSPFQNLKCIFQEENRHFNIAEEVVQSFKNLKTSPSCATRLTLSKCLIIVCVKLQAKLISNKTFSDSKISFILHKIKPTHSNARVS